METNCEKVNWIKLTRYRVKSLMVFNIRILFSEGFFNLVFNLAHVCVRMELCIQFPVSSILFRVADLRENARRYYAIRILIRQFFLSTRT